MAHSMLTGIRNLRSSILSGALLLSGFFILILSDFRDSLELTSSASELISLHSSMPVIIVLIAAYVIGSLYVTALEGLVDWAHRKLLFHDIEKDINQEKKIIFSHFEPLSLPARGRLKLEAERFYTEITHKEPCSEFVEKVFADILWMEGKLTGTYLKETYMEYRTEGEFRLSIGLLLPLAAVTLVESMQTNTLWSSVMIVLSVVAAIQTCIYGLYYFRRAHSLLAHHVSDGNLLTASMETLKRNSV